MSETPFDWMKRINSFIGEPSTCVDRMIDYYQKLKGLAEVIVFATLENYSPTGTNWSYRQLCTGNISVEKRFEILEIYTKAIGKIISSEVLEFHEPTDVGSQLVEMSCFILSWIEAIEDEKQKENDT